jgi:DNA-binding MarR family transcriptional regulator
MDGLTETQRRVLKAVKAQPGASYRDLSRDLDMSASNVHMTVTRLVDKNVLRRVKCPHCGRPMMKVTPKEKATAKRRMPTDRKAAAQREDGAA